MNKFTFDNGVLYNGDCLDVMSRLTEKVNVILTSPPYNTQRNLSDRAYDEYRDSIDNDEYLNFIKKTFDLYDSVLEKNGVILYNLSYGSENPMVMFDLLNMVNSKTKFMIADVITWKKSTAMPNSMSPNKLTRVCEFVYVICRKSEYKTFQSNKPITSVRPNGQKMYGNVHNLIEARNNDGSNPLNKCTFSSELVIELLKRYMRDGDTVLDNFNGTGTTSVGVTRYGGRFIGIELSTEQHKYACERLSDEMKSVYYQTSLL